jgi:hypothetical protein
MQDIDIVFRNKHIGVEELEDIKRTIQCHWDRGRKFISKVMSEHWNWRQPNGQLKDQVCRLLLLRLEEKGYIHLPPRKKSANNELRAYYRHSSEILDNICTTPIDDTVRQIKPIELVQVRKTPLEPLWNELINKYHYLGHNVTVGSHLKYIAFYKGRPLACLAWASATWALRCRDELVGWTAQQRRIKLKHIVNNTRYLILPWVSIKYLASHLLSINTKKLSSDWIDVYGYPVYLLETFVDRNRFRGTCYKAANWIYAGQSKGYAKRIKFYYHGQIKDIYIYPLIPNFREKLIETETI